MPGWLEGAPFWALFAFFFTIAFVRTQVTYWLARCVTVWTLDRTRPARPWVVRVHGWLSGSSTAHGIATIRRWGVVAVPASFLAPGTKTVVNAAAGVVRLPFGRYLPAMTLGCAVHATIYATVGWVAWTAAVSAAAGSPWGAAALVGTLAAVLVAAVVHARRRSPARSSARSLETAEAADVPGTSAPGTPVPETSVPGTSAAPDLR